MAITERSYGVFHQNAAQDDQALIEIDKSRGAIKSIGICNEHASSTAVVGLYLGDGTNKSYIIKDVSIPSGVSLLLDHELGFDNSSLGLFLDLSGGLPVSIIIK